jgi:hypothetical protein
VTALAHVADTRSDMTGAVAVVRPADVVPTLPRRTRATNATVYLAGSPAGRAAASRALADVSVSFPSAGPQRRTPIAGSGVCLCLAAVDGSDPRSWPAPARGVVVGALVLVDPGRCDDCFALLDRLEAGQYPFAVVAGRSGATMFDERAHRAALAVGPGVPVVVGDWHERATVLGAVTRLCELSLAVAESRGHRPLPHFNV